MKVKCTNGCGITDTKDVTYISDKPYYPMCTLSGGNKYLDDEVYSIT